MEGWSKYKKLLHTLVLHHPEHIVNTLLSVQSSTVVVEKEKKLFTHWHKRIADMVMYDPTPQMYTVVAEIKSGDVGGLEQNAMSKF